MLEMKRVLMNFRCASDLRDAVREYTKRNGLKMEFWLCKSIREALERESQQTQKQKSK
jgi:hypothetical protein